MSDISMKNGAGGTTLAASVPQEQLNIIVVDDDPIFRSVAVAKLSRVSSHVSEAPDGAAAWDLIIRQSYQLILVDLEMPGMNGVELIRCIRTHPRTRHVPVVVMTSRNDSDAVRSSLDAGATSFMTKPVNWSMFANHIDYLLKLHAGAERGRVAERRFAQLAEQCYSNAAALSQEVEPRARLVERALREACANVKRGPHAPETVLALESLALEMNQMIGALGLVIAQSRAIALNDPGSQTPVAPGSKMSECA